MNPDQAEREAEAHEKRAHDYEQGMQKELDLARQKHERAQYEREQIAAKEEEEMQRKARELADQQPDAQDRANNQQPGFF